ncbi:hypothetical protein WR25_23008 [Diploscapter pachys]|uniref:Uncharacterized protein n=1 Tax=Diploscapter pachys TaxID=2018661 RepID=A0A2A2L1K3_9BILA|nr:hypothetical protein WR25_23008 [Diploscapter pachys]
MWFFLLAATLSSSLRTSNGGLHYSIQPSNNNNAFFLFEPNVKKNSTTRSIFIQGDCPAFTDSHITVSSGNREETAFFYSEYQPKLHCAVNFKLVQNTVSLDRPYVDVVATADVKLLTFFKTSACVRVQIASQTGGGIVNGNCVLNPFDAKEHTCLVRTHLPFSWFGTIGKNGTKQMATLIYTVAESCKAPFYDRPQIPITLLPYMDNAQTMTLVKENDSDLSLVSKANLSFGPNSLNSLFAHLSHNSTDLNVVEIKLWLDARLDILSISPLSQDWTVRVISAVRPQYHTTFICTRRNKTNSWDDYLFALLLQMKPGPFVPVKDEEDFAVLHWDIRMHRNTTQKSENALKSYKIATKFSIAQDTAYTIVPVASSTEIINTGILSGQQSSTSMRIYTVSYGGNIKDVTSNSHCISSESRVLKTSPTCTTVYVDGSELRGSANIDIHVHFEAWTKKIAFTVWYPRLPLTVWASDMVLNSISGWPITVWKNLQNDRISKRSAKQFSCGNRYQQTEILVLATFQVTDTRTGEKIFLGGEKNALFDVTSFALHTLHSADRNIATVRLLNNGRVVVQANKFGNTRIVLKRPGSSFELSNFPITVTDDSVLVTGLASMPISSLTLDLEPVTGRTGFYTVKSNVETTMTRRYQHCSLMHEVLYSDGSSESLDDVVTQDYNLVAEYTNNRVAAVSIKAQNSVELLAVDDLSEASIRIYLHAPAHCIDSDRPPIAETNLPIDIKFPESESSRMLVERLLLTNSTSMSSIDDSPFRLNSILAILLALAVVISIIKLLWDRNSTFTGYEKLVAPIISRLSSSSSNGSSDEHTKEWVWLSKARIDSNSIGSHYSQKSTLNLHDHSPPSYDDNTQASISYRGSEISIFISPTPTVSVNVDRHHSHSHGGSWKSTGRQPSRNPHILSNPQRRALVDSTSDHNLARVTSNGSIREPRQTQGRHTWNTKRRYTPPEFQGIRESIA